MQKPTSGLGIAKGWDAAAHRAWLAGDRQGAINAVLAYVNAHGRDKPLAGVMQLSYYVFLCGDPAAAARFLEDTRKRHPQEPELLLNLAVCLYRSGQHEAAMQRLSEFMVLRPDDPVAYDTKCSVSYRLGRFAEAAEAGTRALVLKDGAVAPAPGGWRLPDVSPARWASRPGKRDVIAFSLWGAKRRYVHGAIDNVLAAKEVYPGWLPVFFVDESVPAPARARLAELGAEVRLQTPGQPDRQRLAWRFRVANEAAVGRFLVRDVDSVLNPRERAAVAAWIASDRWFHVMRDWWTHSDLMLAGMWGGVAGVLPDVGELLAGYRPRAAETPNVDQWFLRDCVWQYVRTSCLVHDRCFTPPGAQPWPEPPPEGHFHVGQDEHAVRGEQQRARVAPWLGG